MNSTPVVTSRKAVGKLFWCDGVAANETNGLIQQILADPKYFAREMMAGTLAKPERVRLATNAPTGGFVGLRACWREETVDGNFTRHDRHLFKPNFIFFFSGVQLTPG